jgi:hypothetical protein
MRRDARKPLGAPVDFFGLELSVAEIERRPGGPQRALRIQIDFLRQFLYRQRDSLKIERLEVDSQSARSKTVKGGPRHL